MGLGLGPSLGYKWAWALTQAPQGLSNARTSILLSLRGRFDPFISWLTRCRPWPCTICVGHFVVILTFVHLNSRPWRPRSCTWVVFGMLVRFIISMVVDQIRYELDLLGLGWIFGCLDVFLIYLIELGWVWYRDNKRWCNP